MARGVELEVIGLGGRMSIIRSATSDAEGRFRIESLPVDEPLIIRASYKDANYHGQAIFDASGKSYVEIEVFEPTTSMKDIQVEGYQMAFQMIGEELKSLETVTFNNKTNPPRTFVNREGTFRFSKPHGIVELPQIRITAPGSSMPLVQSALESPDGQSYYSLYPLRPGVSVFEVQQILPYKERSYIYAKKFYQDAKSISIGVIPRDLGLSGRGLLKTQTDAQGNFAVYTNPPIKAGSEVIWTFSGGTPAVEQERTDASGEFTIRPMPNRVSQNALIIGPLLLIGFIAVLWYASNRIQKDSGKAADFRTRQLKGRREQLLDNIANLDHNYENHSLTRQEYVRRREEGKRQLRRISALLKRS